MIFGMTVILQLWLSLGIHSQSWLGLHRHLPGFRGEPDVALPGFIDSEGYWPLIDVKTELADGALKADRRMKINGRIRLLKK